MYLRQNVFDQILQYMDTQKPLKTVMVAAQHKGQFLQVKNHNFSQILFFPENIDKNLLNEPH